MIIRQTIPIDVNMIQIKRAVPLRCTAPKNSSPERAPLQIPLMICCQLPNKIPSIIVNMAMQEKTFPILVAASRLVLQKQKQKQGILFN